MIKCDQLTPVLTVSLFWNSLEYDHGPKLSHFQLWQRRVANLSTPFHWRGAMVIEVVTGVCRAWDQMWRTAGRISKGGIWPKRCKTIQTKHKGVVPITWFPCWLPLRLLRELHRLPAVKSGGLPRSRNHQRDEMQRAGPQHCSKRSNSVQAALTTLWNQRWFLSFAPRAVQTISSNVRISIQVKQHGRVLEVMRS